MFGSFSLSPLILDLVSAAPLATLPSGAGASCSYGLWVGALSGPDSRRERCTNTLPPPAHPHNQQIPSDPFLSLNSPDINLRTQTPSFY